MVKIAPSILAADFAEMGAGVHLAEQAGADYIHCDVMDGVFVPNITFGPQMIRDLRSRTALPLDVHLMITEPSRFVERFAEAGADIITFHVEAETHVQKTLNMIRSCGCRAGIVLNPATPLHNIPYLLEDLDMVVLMSVNPGFGGQRFLPAVLDKISDLRNMLGSRPVEIEVDGGIQPDTAQAAVQAGADVLVAGSAVYNAADPAQMLKAIREAGQ